MYFTRPPAASGGYSRRSKARDLCRKSGDVPAKRQDSEELSPASRLRHLVPAERSAGMSSTYHVMVESAGFSSTPPSALPVSTTTGEVCVCSIAKRSKRSCHAGFLARRIRRLRRRRTRSWEWTTSGRSSPTIRSAMRREKSIGAPSFGSSVVVSRRRKRGTATGRPAAKSTPPFRLLRVCRSRSRRHAPRRYAALSAGRVRSLGASS